MILITGTAGFIGNALALKLLETDTEIIGIDNHNDYYDTNLKDARLDRIKKFKNYTDFLNHSTKFFKNKSQEVLKKINKLEYVHRDR